MRRTSRIGWVACGGLLGYALMSTSRLLWIGVGALLGIGGVTLILLIRAWLFVRFRGRLFDRVLARAYQRAARQVVFAAPEVQDRVHQELQDSLDLYTGALDDVDPWTAVLSLKSFTEHYRGTALQSDGLLDFTQPPLD